MLKKLLIILFVCGLLLAAYQFAKAKELLPKEFFTQVEAKLPKKITLPWQKEEELNLEQVNLNQMDLEKLGTDGIEQVKILAGKAKEAGTVAQDFVAEVVKEDKGSEKNVSEKAFEYGKYIYCQEVVKQYEASHGATKN